jgi:hypothetical protein
MVSVGELRVGRDGAAHVALRQGTTTAANLRRDGRALLLAFPGAAVRAGRPCGSSVLSMAANQDDSFSWAGRSSWPLWTMPTTQLCFRAHGSD